MVFSNAAVVPGSSATNAGYATSVRHKEVGAGVVTDPFSKAGCDINGVCVYSYYGDSNIPCCYSQTMWDWETLVVEKQFAPTLRIIPPVIIHFGAWIRYKIVLVSRLAAVVLLVYVCCFCYTLYRNHSNVTRMELVHLLKRVREDIDTLPHGHITTRWDGEISSSDHYSFDRSRQNF